MVKRIWSSKDFKMILTETGYSDSRNLGFRHGEFCSPDFHTWRMIRRLQAKRWVILGWQNVKKVAHKVTQPEDITESTQQEEKYSFYSKYTQYVNFLTEFDSHHKYALSLHGFLSTVAIFHFWNWNILLPQLQSTSSHSSQINKSVQSAKNKFYAMFMVCKGARMNTASYSLYVHNYE